MSRSKSLDSNPDKKEISSLFVSTSPTPTYVADQTSVAYKEAKKICAQLLSNPTSSNSPDINKLNDHLDALYGVNAVKKQPALEFKSIKDFLPAYYKPLGDWIKEVAEILINLGVLTDNAKTRSCYDMLNLQILLALKQGLPHNIRQITPKSNLNEFIDFLIQYDTPRTQLLDQMQPINTQNVKYFFYQKITSLQRAQPYLDQHTLMTLAWEIVMSNATQRLRDLSIILGVINYPSAEQLDKLAQCMQHKQSGLPFHSTSQYGGNNTPPFRNTDRLNNSLNTNQKPNNSVFQKSNSPNFNTRPNMNNSYNRPNNSDVHQQYNNASSPPNNITRGVQQVTPNRQFSQPNTTDTRNPNYAQRQSSRLQNMQRINYRETGRRNNNIESRSMSPSRQWGKA